MGRLAAHNRDTRPQHGFTLIEVLIAIALAVVVIGMLMIPLTSSMGYFRSATARGDAQTVARNALDIMARELSEAAYVQQDMEDNSMIAFAPPLRVNPSDPNSAIVTPPRPDWDHMVRYWRALHDPENNYVAVSRLGEPNTFFLARTVLESPFKTDDAWNRENDAWAATMEADQPGVHWAPRNRVVHRDIDLRPQAGGYAVGTRNTTLQPGYPYLEARWRYTDDKQLARYYRDRVKGLTPDSVDFDVTALSFEPMVVSGEWLIPARGASALDKSVYLARYPLWRLGVPYESWTALQGENPVFGQELPPPWALDPFLLIYHYSAAAKRYGLAGIGCFDPRSRTMKVIAPPSLGSAETVLYDTFDYPRRTATTTLAFDVDWINGAVRFDFPPFDTALGRTNNKPLQLSLAGVATTPVSDGVRNVNVYETALSGTWRARPDKAALDQFLLADSVSVKLNSTANGVDQPGRALQQVFRVPRDYSDEYQLGTSADAAVSSQPRYGWIRLPEHLAGGQETNAIALWVYYRWRSNGLVEAGADETTEHPDLVCAYYRTGAIVDISLTVTRADPSARAADRLSQSVHMTRRVKLRSAMREIADVR